MAPRSRNKADGAGDGVGGDAPKKEDMAKLFGDDDVDRYAVGSDKKALFESFKAEGATNEDTKHHHNQPRHRKQQQANGGGGGKVYYANVDEKQERALAAAQKAASTKRSRDSEGFTWKKASIGLLFLSLFSAGALSTVFTIYDFFAAGFKHIDIQDSTALRQVLLSGEPALVYCFDKSLKVNKIPPVLKEADRDLRGIASTYTMDCHQPLPDTGKSIYQKYKFSNNLMPAFVVANGDRPIQLNANSMANSQTVVEFTKANTRPIVRFAKNAKQLDSMCLSRQKCLLIGYRSKFPDAVKKVVREAMKSHRGMRVVALDTAKYRLKLDPAVVAAKREGDDNQQQSNKKKKNLSFMCLNTPDRKVDLDGLTKGMVEVLPLTSKGKELERDYDAVSFLSECDAGNSPNMREMLQLPSISIRPPKQPKAKSQTREEGKRSNEKDEKQRLREEFHEKRKQKEGRETLNEQEPPIITDVDDYEEEETGGYGNDDDSEWDDLLNSSDDDEEEESNSVARAISVEESLEDGRAGGSGSTVGSSTRPARTLHRSPSGGVGLTRTASAPNLLVPQRNINQLQQQQQPLETDDGSSEHKNNGGHNEKRRIISLSAMAKPVAGGVISGLVIVFRIVSLASVYFSDPLIAPWIGVCQNSILISAMVSQLFHCNHKIKGLIAAPSSVGLPFLSTITAAYVEAAGSNAKLAVSQVLTIFGATTLAFGLFLFVIVLIGRDYLNTIKSGFPQPVIYGFFTAVGLAMCKSSNDTAVGFTIKTFADFSHTMTDETLLLQSIAGCLCGLMNRFGSRWFPNPLILPCIFIIELFLLYGLICGILGLSLSEARDNKWLFASLPYQPLTALVEDYGNPLTFDYGYLFSEYAVAIFSMFVVYFVDMSAGAVVPLEAASHVELNMKSEIERAAVSNTVCGLMGGSASYVSYSNTRINQDAGGGTTRWSGFFYAVSCFVWLLVGQSLLQFVPKPWVAGMGGSKGMLYHIAFGYLLDGVWDPRHLVNGSEKFVVALIAVTYLFKGVVWAICAGLALCCIYFTLRESSAPVVTFETDVRSTKARTIEEMNILDDSFQDKTIVVAKTIINSLFFGSGARFSQALTSYTNDFKNTRYLVLDFESLTSIDSSALVSLNKIPSLLPMADGARFVIANLTRDNLVNQVKKFVKQAKVFDDIDTALEYVEDKCIVTKLSQFEMLESGMLPGRSSSHTSTSSLIGAEDEHEGVLASDNFGLSSVNLSHYSGLPSLESYEDLANLSYDMYEQQPVYESEEDRATMINSLCRRLVAKIFGDSLVEPLLSKMQRMEVSLGDVVYEEGQIAKGAYLIVSGELSLYTGPVRVHTHMGGDFSPLTAARVGPAMDIPRTRRQNHRIRVVGSGDFLCDSAVYGVYPHSNTMVADSYSTILLLPRDSLLRLEHEHPKSAMQFHAIMATRLSREVIALKIKRKSRRGGDRRGSTKSRGSHHNNSSSMNGNRRDDVTEDNAGVGDSGWRGLYRGLNDQRQYARRHMSSCE
ncbi:hypothetical protein FOL47_008269 [Perkinsus chesapeaki]|uniref:STAS domain-containing protein n=1 Tax=Perkinsus chesapeaki TaxID=330153 RepID=A0A7J6MUA1_PERCH|nr:hypothetical protein FOL47_008269 [Perkinsus chesapeaki]